MKKTFKTGIISALVLALFLCLFAGITFSFRRASAEEEGVKYQFDNLELKADDGEKTTIDLVNPKMDAAGNQTMGLTHGNVLFTGGHTSFVSGGSKTNSVALLVNAETFEVKQVYNQNATSGAFQAGTSTWITPSSKEFVIVGFGTGLNSPDEVGGRKFLLAHFNSPVTTTEGEGETATTTTTYKHAKILLDGAETTVANVLTATKQNYEFDNTNYVIEGLTVTDADNNTAPIHWVNPMPGKGTPSGSGLILYTEGHTSYISDGSETSSVAALIDAATGKVKQVVNQTLDGNNNGQFETDAKKRVSTWLFPQKGEYVLAAFSSGYGGEAEHTLRKFLAKDLLADEVVTLKINNEAKTIAEVLKATEKGVSLKVNELSATSTERTVTVSGKLYNGKGTEKVYLRQYDENNPDGIDVERTELTVGQDGGFSKEITLTLGKNYVEVFYIAEGDTTKMDFTKATVTYKLPEVNPYIVEGLEVAAKPETQDTAAIGKKHDIYYVNPDYNDIGVDDYNYVVMFTEGHPSLVTEGSRKSNTAIVVDAETLVVKQVINKSKGDGQVPQGEDTLYTPAQGEFVLLGVDSGYNTYGHKKYIAENFEVGDKITLLLKGDETTVADILQISEGLRSTSMKISSEKGAFTTSSGSYTLEGRINFAETDTTYQVIVRKFGADSQKIGDDVVIDVDRDYNFTKEIGLSKGLNYLEITYKAGENEIEGSKVKISAYNKQETEAPKEYVMWIDQFSSAVSGKARIESSFKKMQKAGVTAVAYEVKGTEGYASYRKATLTGVPYYTATKNKQAAVASVIAEGADYDTFAEILAAGKKYGIKVYAALNFLTEGVISGEDSAVLGEHADWEEKVYAPAGKGEIKTATEMSKLPGGGYILNYVNPANPEVVAFQVNRVKEILANYEVDGIMLDRCRYDNKYADFSDVSRDAFKEYLKGLNDPAKTFEDGQFPNVVYSIDRNGNMEPGALYYDWYTFRASVIKSFVGQIKTAVDAHNTEKSDNAILAQYVGNSYESMWEMGLNWASEDFNYTSSLGASFGGLAAMKNLYTAKYNKQSYLEMLDFLMVGTYGTSVSSVKNYATLANIVTDCKIPVYGSIDLGANKDAALERDIIKACTSVTEGCMLFSISSADMNKVTAAIADREYIKPEQFYLYSAALGNPYSISVVNTTRVANEYCYYDRNYGEMPDVNGTSVSVVVGADGKIVAVDNKEAVEIITGPTGQNTFKMPTTKIPDGGFAIATPGGTAIKTDRNDTRRVLSRLSAGDDFTAVYLTDYVKYDGESYDASSIDFTFAAAILGSQEGVTVTVNGVAATKGEAFTEGEEGTPNGVYNYSAPVALKYGKNTVRIEFKCGSAVILSQNVTVESTKPTLERIVASDTMFRTEVGKSVNIGASLFPKEAVETITYKSNDEKIATVDAEGNITGVKAGKTTIELKAGDKTLTVTVTVTGGKKSGANTGVILGCVIGAAVLATGASFLIAYLIRKKRK